VRSVIPWATSWQTPSPVWCTWLGGMDIPLHPKHRSIGWLAGLGHNGFGDSKGGCVLCTAGHLAKAGRCWPYQPSSPGWAVLSAHAHGVWPAQHDLAMFHVHAVHACRVKHSSSTILVAIHQHACIPLPHRRLPVTCPSLIPGPVLLLPAMSAAHACHSLYVPHASFPDLHRIGCTCCGSC